MVRWVWRLKMLIILFLYILAGMHISCSRENHKEIPPQNTPVEEDLQSPYSLFEIEILELVNQYRSDLHLKELQNSDVISQQAQQHNQHMINRREVCHHNFGARFSYLKKRIGAKSMGENVAFGYGTANAVVSEWLKSEAHYSIIISQKTHFGVAADEGTEGKLYVTMIFVKK